MRRYLILLAAGLAAAQTPGAPGVVNVMQYGADPTGTADIDSVIYSTGTSKVSISGCNVSGNSHVAATVHANMANHGLFRDLFLYSNSKAPPGACLELDNGNTNRVDNILCSGAFNAGNPHPANWGLIFLDDVNDTVILPQLENIPNAGIKLKRGRGVACGGIQFFGGTSEANGVGVDIDPGCGGNVFLSLDIEVTATAGIVDGGSHNSYWHTSATKVHFLPTASRSTFENGDVDSMTIDPGAHPMVLRNNSYNNNGGAYLPDKIPGRTGNCASAASPAECGSAAAGYVIVAAGNKLGVACNAAYVAPWISARAPGASFTISVASPPVGKPACFSYTVVN